jgi:hypothetical protein
MTFRTSQKQHRRGTVTLTPNKTTPGFETKSEYIARIKREEAEAVAKQEAAAAEAARNDELAKSAMKAAARQVALETLFVEPSPELAAKCPALPAEVAGTEDEILAACLKAAQTAFSGQRLSKAVKDKIITVIRLNGLDARDSKTWTTVYEHIRDLGGFVDDGIPSAQPEPIVQPSSPVASQRSERPTAQEESFDSLLNRLDTESRSGRAVLKDAAEAEKFKEASPMFNEWLDHLLKDYNFVPTAEDKKYVVLTLFPRNNWSLTHGENWNKARRAMVNAGRWPSSMLTADERNAIDMENTNYSSDYATNREVKRRLREAQN